MPPRTEVVPLERVRCLECAATYLKPSGGGIVGDNPGCPRCGYVGWISVVIPRADERHRSDADPLRRLLARTR